MKHKIRDIIIFLIALSGTAWFYRRRMMKQGPLVRVIAFHDVADRQWFADTLDLLKAKYNVITPTQFNAGEYDKDKINILITFDDGYQTWIDNCLPELEDRGFKALFFVNSGLLDCTSREEVTAFYQDKVLISPKEPLTWDGARRLKAAGHTIAPHTVNHVSMANVSLEVAREELLKDKARFEEMLGDKVQYFAYPFGTKSDYNEETIRLVKELGIPYQFSAVTGFTKKSDMTHIIPRTLIENNQPLTSINKWLEGGYDVFKVIQN